jgi:hypothetical protein
VLELLQVVGVDTSGGKSERSHIDRHKRRKTRADDLRIEKSPSSALALNWGMRVP